MVYETSAIQLQKVLTAAEKVQILFMNTTFISLLHSKAVWYSQRTDPPHEDTDAQLQFELACR